MNGKLIPHFLGNSFPKLTFVTRLYCFTSSLLLSFGPCSNDPNPKVLNLPVAETVAKSAIFASIDATAAIPPLLFKPDILNSLNQTSPVIFLPVPVGSVTLVLFLIPTIKVLTSPKFGFPLIPSRKLSLPSPSGKEASSSG